MLLLQQADRNLLLWTKQYPFYPNFYPALLLLADLHHETHKIFAPRRHEDCRMRGYGWLQIPEHALQTIFLETAMPQLQPIRNPVSFRALQIPKYETGNRLLSR